MVLLLLSRVRFGVGPDEETHFRIIQYYAQNSLDPFLDKQKTDFYLGSLQREVSYLYHYILSIPYRAIANFGESTSVYIIRLFNLVLGTSSLVVLNLLAISLGLRKIIRVSLIFLFANVPVFIFLSSSVNYDNLVILLSFVLIYVSVLNRKVPSINKSLAIIVLSAMGPLVKFAFLPISLIAILYLLSTYIRNSKIFKRELKSSWHNKATIVLSVLVILLSILFAERYLFNVIKFRQIIPSCEKILLVEQCKENFVYNRTSIYKAANLPPPIISKEAYLISWNMIMVERTYGILAHISLKKAPEIISFGVLGIYLLILAFIRKYNPKKDTYWVIPATTLFYLVGLIITNYGIYKYSSNIGLAVSGRYWLPVLLPFIVYTASLYNHLSRKTVTVVSIIICSFAFISGLPNILHIFNGII
jgi:hypothetical protein